MERGIPDEVHVQEWPSVMTGGLLRPPSLYAKLVQSTCLRMFRLLVGGVLVEQTTEVLQYLVPKLHSHALLRDRSQQGSQHQLAPVTTGIRSKIRSQAF